MAWISSYTALANGLAANDGTGNTLRDGASIINTNFDSFATAINAQAVSLNSGMVGYATKADMDADLSHPEGTLALVTNDPTAANNASYRKSGASGAGSWQTTVDRVAQQSADLISVTVGKGAALVGFAQAGTGSVARTVNDKILEQVVSILDKGASTSFTDNQGPIASALTTVGTKGELLVPPGTFTTNVLPDNRYGVDIRGTGKLMISDAYGGAEQINTYRHTKPIFTGKEYLWAVYNVMNVTARPIRCYLYGDSTVQGGTFIDPGNYVQMLLPDLVAAKGVRNLFSATNRGVGGSNLSTWNPTPDIGVNSATYADLVILKCGINDGSFPISTRLDTFRDNLRAGLANIRAVSGGDVGQTAILLVGPNVTIDKENHQRNPEWYEQLRGIFEAACVDYKCAYFDTYQFLQDAGNRDGSLWAMARWINQDSTAGNPPAALHPRNVGQLWIWGAIVDSIFGTSDIVRWSGNRFYARSAYFGFPYAANPPTWYPNNYADGITTEVARAADGFPFDGMLTTIKNSDGFLIQYLSANNTSGLVFTRTSDTADNYWGLWAGSATAIGATGSGSSFSNGWGNFGGIYGGARAMITSNNNVTLDGMIKPGTTAAGTTILTLPTGMAPGNQRVIFAASDAGLVQMELTSGGQLNMKTGTPTIYVSLSGITFRR